MTTLDPSPTPAATATRACYAITDRFHVDLTDTARRMEVWCPVVADTPHQRVLDLAVDADRPGELTRETEFGTVMFHGGYTAPLPTRFSVEIRYLVERLPLTLDLTPERARPLTTPELFARTLEPEKHVDVDDRTRELAREVVGAETNPLEQARRIYDHVTGAMTYNAAEQSWKGSTEHALACSVGNCNDIHALFVSLCRSVGIPARFVLGQALEPPVDGVEACDLCGYHCWAEFFVAGLGWLPADASCACKYDRHGLFGALEPNHIAWSVGRDLLFNPPQRGARSLFFAAPYAEVDGRSVPVDRGIRFTEVA